MIVLYIFALICMLLVARYIIWFFGFHFFVARSGPAYNFYKGMYLRFSKDYRTFRITNSTDTHLTFRRVWRW
jgi:hypothetical protein